MIVLNCIRRTLLASRRCHIHLLCPLSAMASASQATINYAPTKIRKDSLHILDVAIKSVLPCNMVRKALQMTGTTLTVGDAQYSLDHNVHVIAFGKAALGMVRAAEDVLGDHIVGGIASVPVGVQEAFRDDGKLDLLPHVGSKVKVIEGSPNNIPDEAAHQAALEIQQLAKSLKTGDIALTLITGGGSALLPAPIPPITLEDVAQVTRLMSQNGGNIHQLNTVRKNVELLKGGALAGAAHPAQVISLILSDVIGSPLDLIASGPTVADYSTPRQCLDLFNLLGVIDEVPSSILTFLQMEVEQASPKMNMIQFGGEDSPMLGPQPQHSCCNAQNVLVGSNEIAVDAAFACAEQLGYFPLILNYGLDGEACQVGVMFSALAEYFSHAIENKRDRTNTKPLGDLELSLIKQGISKDKMNEIIRLAERATNCGKPVCILAGGETTVTVTGKGKGGRNQEMALAAAMDMNDRIKHLSSGFDFGFLSAGTDGQDGPTDAAGAYVDPNLITIATDQGLNPNLYLSNNASYTFFTQVADGQNLIITGLTGTNVMDLQVLLIVPKLSEMYLSS